MNPPEELFPGVKWEWEHNRWHCWVGNMLCYLEPDRRFADHRAAFSKDGHLPIVGGPVGPEAIPWLRAQCIEHLRSLVAPTGMRLVTMEQLKELVNTARNVEITIGGRRAPLRKHQEAMRALDAAWEAVGGRP